MAREGLERAEVLQSFREAIFRMPEVKDTAAKEKRRKKRLAKVARVYSE